MAIMFTQYLMPNGQKKPLFITLSPEVEEKAQKIEAAGYVFELELLRDWTTVSLTIADSTHEKDVACKLVTNGPLIPSGVTALIMDFQIPSCLT